MDDSDAELFGESDDDDNPDGVRSAAALFGVLDLLDDDGEQNSKAATKDAFKHCLSRDRTHFLSQGGTLAMRD